MDATRRDPAVPDVGVGPAVPMANHVVPRPRVFDLLDRCARSPVTLVAAPAGWGKTLLAASWIAAGGGGWQGGWQGRRR